LEFVERDVLQLGERIFELEKIISDMKDEIAQLNYLISNNLPILTLSCSSCAKDCKIRNQRVNPVKFVHIEEEVLRNKHVYKIRVRQNCGNIRTLHVPDGLL
jgi:hypothetical protein